MEINKINTLLILFGFSSAISMISIVQGIEVLKYVFVLLYFCIFILSFDIAKRNKHKIDELWLILPVCIIFLYPILFLIYDIINLFSMKAFIDGILIKGGYYQLVFVALPIVLSMDKIDFYALLFKYTSWLSPVGIVIFLFIFSTTDNEYSFVVGYWIISNVLLPSTLLIFDVKVKKHCYFGVGAIILMFLFSSYMGTRSYTIVCILIAIAAYMTISKSSKKLAYCGILGLFSLYFIDLSSIFSIQSDFKNASIADKFQIDSLIVAINDAIVNQDLSYVFYWEGNSRAGILVDAFSNFDVWDWLFGKGGFATYDSFVTRSTIEMGWIQDTFRWGIIYTLLTVLLVLNSAFSIVSYRKVPIFNLFFTVLIIRWIDGWVYGMPSWDIYNLLFFIGVMLRANRNLFIKNNLNNTLDIKRYI